MKTAMIEADDILRGRGLVIERTAAAGGLLRIALLVALFGILYGAVMGSFGVATGERFWQLVISAVKVPMLLLCTFVITLPSYFVVSSLFGLREDFRYCVRALLATQAGLTIILASCAPFTALWYASTSNYRGAILFNALMFGLATFSAQVILKNLYRPLIERNNRHRWLLRIWLIVYAFVGIQMGWVLRPFIGSPNMPVQFFREGAWGNAYIVLFDLIMSLLRGT